MDYNYHTHTTRCGHAVGTDEEYVQAAIQAGIKTLGFSEHAPILWKESGTWAPEDQGHGNRMFMDKFDDYMESITSLRDKYKGQIEIRIGFELEYFPGPFEKTSQFLLSHGAEYLIQGQHALGNEVDDFYCFDSTSDPEILKRYVDQTCEGVSTGVYTYLAHPDVVEFVGDEATYRHEMERLCTFMRDKKMPIEINLHGLGTGRNYPNLKFWEIAGEGGNEVVIGYDAHNPKELANKEVPAKALELVKRFALNFNANPQFF